MHLKINYMYMYVLILMFHPMNKCNYDEFELKKILFNSLNT